MQDARIDDKGYTYQSSIIPDDTDYLFLYDETRTKKEYEPLQFHWHAPSEHTFNGKHYDMELHIVHKNTDASELSVLGIFFDMQAGGNQSNWFIEQFM
jgi:carbonic anhydrase